MGMNDAEMDFADLQARHGDWADFGRLCRAPVGWRALIERTFDEIAAVVRPTGRRVRVGGVHEDDAAGALGIVVDLLALDEADAGRVIAILRDARLRSRAVCAVCGARGRAMLLPGVGSSRRSPRCDAHPTRSGVRAPDQKIASWYVRHGVVYDRFYDPETDGFTDVEAVGMPVEIRQDLDRLERGLDDRDRDDDRAS